MLFNSFEFLVFLAITYALYLVLPHRKQNWMLLVASYVFYGWWDWRFLGIIAFTTILDYVVSLRIVASTAEREKRAWLGLSVGINLGLLGVFKYFNFFVESFVELANHAGLHVDWVPLHIILPVGISFYTFQSISYSIDVYRGQIAPPRRFLDYALFVAFFPQMVAGPIQRATYFLPQVVEPRQVDLDQVCRGAFLILYGLFKKAVIADGLAGAVGSVFNAAGAHSGLDVFVATYLFVLQIYCDFSGYTDIARGVAKLMGFNLSKNFMTPFYSASPAEYWTRWHISLSSWVKDYVYFPLALHYLRKGDGKLDEYKPHLISMLLMGLWHGAAWTYILWGLYHGLMLIAWDLFKWPRSLKRASRLLVKPLRIAFYFQITAISLLIFRANSVHQIGDLLLALVGRGGTRGFTIPTPPTATLLAIPLLLGFDYLSYHHSSDLFYRKWPDAARGVLVAALFILLLMGWSNAPAEFIYFQF
jgi:D-alanyl-lipoteichoic acid acyltransferase DltB (MBOAT superfamily)